MQQDLPYALIRIFLPGVTIQSELDWCSLCQRTARAARFIYLMQTWLRVTDESAGPLYLSVGLAQIFQYWCVHGQVHYKKVQYWNAKICLRSFRNCVTISNSHLSSREHWLSNCKMSCSYLLTPSPRFVHLSSFPFWPWHILSYVDNGSSFIPSQYLVILDTVAPWFRTVNKSRPLVCSWGLRVKLAEMTTDASRSYRGGHSIPRLWSRYVSQDII